MKDSSSSVIDIAKQIVEQSIPLLKKCKIDKLEHKLDYVDIFPETQKEHIGLSKQLKDLGKPVYKTSTGTTYKLKNPIQTTKGTLHLLRVRNYSSDRKGLRGHPDYAVDDFEKAKKALLGKNNVNLIVRPDYEMIEIVDKDFEVSLYIPSIPLSEDVK